jgi:hypothetical protein
MADREFTVKAKFEGKQAEAKAKQFAGNLGNALKGAAQEGNRQAESTKKMGMAMSAFNEKTEKGRQLMTAFGGSLGAAGGQATYYAGTLSYVIGRFSKAELATMGLIGGLVAIC